MIATKLNLPAYPVKMLSFAVLAHIFVNFFRWSRATLGTTEINHVHQISFKLYELLFQKSAMFIIVFIKCWLKYSFCLPAEPINNRREGVQDTQSRLFYKWRTFQILCSNIVVSSASVESPAKKSTDPAMQWWWELETPFRKTASI